MIYPIIRPILNRFPRLKARLKKMARLERSVASVSSNFVEIEGSEVDSESVRLRGAWQSEDIPRRQRDLVNNQLAKYRRGGAIDVFDVLVQALRSVTHGNGMVTVLEVGCSSGYYSEVLEIAKVPATYSGCDYSAAFISLAREIYPSIEFRVEDATKLSYETNAFDVVISGSCLLHIPEYETAIAETSRVARQYAIFHRTPVVMGQPNKFFRKLAYGVESVEIHFNEPQFLTLLRKHGFELLETYTLGEEWDQDDPQRGNAYRTYVCQKTIQ